MGWGELTSTSAVIPVISRHVHHIPDVLSDLDSQTTPNDEIIIVASGFSSKDFARLRRRADRFKALNIILIRAPLGPAGKNRNLGADAARGDLIMFLDVDDRYLPWRNERVLEAFKEGKFDALVHLADHSSEPGSVLAMKLGNARNPLDLGYVVAVDEIFRDTFPKGERDREAEVVGSVPTNLVLAGPNSDKPIHHAHATVRRSIFLNYRYHENFYPRNEDGLFLRDLLFARMNVGVLLEDLSIFSTATSAVHWKAKLAWLIKSLGKSSKV